MKIFVLLLNIFLLLFCVKVNAQEMQQGFYNLENGEFEEAESFFAAILEDHPENKTARLCYARAVGLHNNPGLAKDLFGNLLKDYPNDLEVKLNYAESLLWNKQYEKAEVYYKTLVSENPENFGALLGYANTLSNLKDYQPALTLVNRALNVSHKNPNALTSRKYIRLGYANQYLRETQYENALNLLDANLRDFPNDKESLLNKANVYLITRNSSAAKSVYESLALNLNDSIVAYNGMALAAHVGGQEKEALKYANLALSLSEKSTDSLKVLEAKERYAQALIWNNKYGTAEDLIAEMKIEYGPEIRILALEATLGMYTGDFKMSIENYKRILEKDSASFDGNLGIANAYFARGEAGKAKNAADKTLSYYTNQQDAMQFLKKIDKIYAPVLEENLSYSYDNGDNKAVASRTGVRFPVNSNLEFSGAFTYRETKNSTTNLEAASNQFDLAGLYRLSPVFSLKARGGFVTANSSQTDYTNLVGEFSLAVKPFVRDDLEIGYRRDLQDFNAELLNRQIAGNHLFLNNNYTASNGLGWYLQYMYTEQSDENNRNLLFTSIYYSFIKKPILKGGFNYQYISFKKQMPELYFSPEKFQAAEVFINLLGNDPNSKLNYDLTIATGYQFIENEPKQSTYRFQGRLGYRIGDRFTAGVYGNHSNIASATAAGFTFTEFGINLRWQITKKPLFKL
ncbi:tetratricopeptide repeat protein [Salegentibacter maritimus]|uniref:tetratricopeptide repeat protein n=1 Tax=Salegentibacter maritimus TaxID=2794347 RepID=UPI0018E4B843|nr:tetratricopeptide repeat protein [Salegentibacter maritimus]MBI6118057.1 tetratricopeptide repeat protein [Salegentibacter maritimus]